MAMNKEQFNNDMNALSNAINEKTGGTEPMTISEMVNAVKSISSGGGGGSVEACTVTFALDGPFMVDGVFIATYMNSSSQIVTTEISIGDSITCLKNSIIAVQNCPLTTSLSGGLSKIFYAQTNWAIRVSSDGTLYIAA